jgi:hypothetical protein
VLVLFVDDAETMDMGVVDDGDLNGSLSVPRMKVSVGALGRVGISTKRLLFLLAVDASPCEANKKLSSYFDHSSPASAAFRHHTMASSRRLRDSASEVDFVM